VTTIEHSKSAALTRRLPALLLITGALCQPMAASAQEMSVRYNKYTGGQFGDVFNLETLAVVDFLGSDGHDFAEALGGELKNLQINNKPAFSIRNERTGPALSKARTPEAGKPYAIQIGQKFGMKGVVWGEVNNATITTDRHKGEKVKSAAEIASDTYKRMTGQTVPPPAMVDCVNHSGSYTVTPYIFKTDGGSIVYTKQFSKNSSVEICAGVVKGSPFLGLPQGGNTQAITPAGLIALLRKQVIADIIREMRPPAPTQVTVRFKTKFPDVADAALRAKLEQSVTWLSEDIEVACRNFMSAGAGEKTEQYSLLFNIAACLEVRQNEKAARGAYLAAREKLITEQKRPDSSLTAALRRTGALQ